MKIRNRLYFGFAAIALLYVCSAMISVVCIRSVRDEMKRVEERSIPLSRTLLDMKFAGLKIVESTSEYVLLIKENASSEILAEEKEEIDIGLTLFRESFETYHKLVTAYSSGREDVLTAIEKQGTKLQTAAADFVKAAVAGLPEPEYRAKKNFFEDNEDILLKYISDTIDKENQEMVKGQKRIDAVISVALGTLAGMTVVIFLASIGVGLYVARSITVPIATLNQMSKKIASSDYAVRIDIKSKDETGELSASFNKMADSLSEYVGKIRDANEKLEKASQEKSRFLAYMFHDIRVPMNAVLGFAKLLRGTELDVKQQDYLDTIITSGEGLVELLNSILDISKIESGKLVLENVDFDVASIVTNAFQLMSSELEGKTIDFRFEIAPDIPQTVSGDPMRLQQVLLNLLSNAIKFTDKGEIVLRVEVVHINNPRFLRFSVRDTGIGMAKSTIDDLFKPYAQADTSIARNFGGSGLGLVICKQLVGLMGGKITVESELGKGSIFSFTARFNG